MKYRGTLGQFGASSRVDGAPAAFSPSSRRIGAHAAPVCTDNPGLPHGEEEHTPDCPGWLALHGLVATRARGSANTSPTGGHGKHGAGAGNRAPSWSAGGTAYRIPPVAGGRISR